MAYLGPKFLPEEGFWGQPGVPPTPFPPQFLISISRGGLRAPQFTLFGLSWHHHQPGFLGPIMCDGGSWQVQEGDHSPSLPSQDLCVLCVNRSMRIATVGWGYVTGAAPQTNP